MLQFYETSEILDRTDKFVRLYPLTGTQTQFLHFYVTVTVFKIC